MSPGIFDIFELFWRIEEFLHRGKFVLSKLHWVITWIKSGQTALEKKYCGEIIDDRSFDLACFRLRNETRTRFLRKYVVYPYLLKVKSKINLSKLISSPNFREKFIYPRAWILYPLRRAELTAVDISKCWISAEIITRFIKMQISTFLLLLTFLPSLTFGGDAEEKSKVRWKRKTPRTRQR